MRSELTCSEGEGIPSLGSLKKMGNIADTNRDPCRGDEVARQRWGSLF